MADDIKTTNSPKTGNLIDFKLVFSVIIGLRWWMLLGVVICMSAAYAYTRMTRVRYTATEKIMLINKENSATNQAAVLGDVTGFSGHAHAANEVEIIRSHSIMQEVVEALGLNYSYYRKRLVKSPFYYENHPFELVFDDEPLKGEIPAISLVVTPADSSSYRILELKVGGSDYPFENRPYRFGEKVAVFSHVFCLTSPSAVNFTKGSEYLVTTRSSFSKASEMQRKLGVEIGGSTARAIDIITLRFTDINPKLCEDVLNMVSQKYNESAREFNSKAASNTVDFLNERLAAIENEIGDIDDRFVDYRSSTSLVNVASQSQMNLAQSEKYNDELNAVDLQLQLLGIIKDYITGMERTQVIPANIGISDAGLNGIINQYNTMVMERNRAAAASSEKNPIVISSDAQLRELLNSIDASVRNLERSYQIQRQKIQSQIYQGRREIRDIPLQEQKINQFTREKEVKEPLYILLQQKKEEAMIMLYSEADQCRVVDSSLGTATPTAPNKKQIMLIAFILGLCFPPAYFLIRELVKNTVDGKRDVTNRTNLPILASVPKCQKGDHMINVSSRDSIDESIRILRSNLRFFPHKVYQITSSLPGEGKTMIAANVAVSLAQVGKKVLLIGADLRKPRLGEFFEMEEKRHHSGLSSYLIGHAGSASEIIMKNVKDISGLDVVFAGNVPPNPTELIESSRMERFMNEIKEMDYDFILLDSAPYIPVADAGVINKLVDANIFIIRTGLADLRFIGELDTLSQTGRLKNVAIVINGVDTKSRSYGYYYGYGYGHYGYGHYGYGSRKGGRGYGYGYGYGTGYGSDTESGKKNKASLDKQSE